MDVGSGPYGVKGVVLGSVGLVADGLAEFVEMKKTKRPFAVVIQDPQVVGLMQIVLHGIEMLAIARFRQFQRDLMGDELFDAFDFQLLDETLRGG